MSDNYKKRPDSGPRPNRRPGPRPGQRPHMSLSDEIMQLDEELIRLLVRRSELIRKLRKGKTHAATPAVIKSEKQIRNAWEAAVSKVSRNPRLSRQLFSLIQDLDIQPPKDDVSLFNLAPARQPVEIDLPGPIAGEYTQLWLALSAYCGKAVTLYQSARLGAVMDTVKAFNQCGCAIEWSNDQDGIPILTVKAGQSPNFYEKSIFVGDDALTLYLFAFLGVGRTGKIRLTGGSALKEADLGALGRFMPTLGARLAWVVPGSKGLPAALECSGILPARVELPDDLPHEAVQALLLAALTWGHALEIVLPEREDLGSKIALLEPIFRSFPGLVRINERLVTYSGAVFCEQSFPDLIRSVLYPLHCAYMLALPMFTGGWVKLHGELPDSDYLYEIISFLKFVSVSVIGQDNSVSSSITHGLSWPRAVELDALSAQLHPLFWVFNARLAHKSGSPVRLEQYPADADLDLATDFLAQVGVDLQPDGKALVLSLMSQDDFKFAAAKNYGWTSPGALWGVALALGAFLKPNLKLSNPDCVTDIMPFFWQMYNNLPAPKAKPADKPVEKTESSRRRIVTDTVVEPESLLDEGNE